MLIVGLSMKTVLVALFTYQCERCRTTAEHEVTRHVRRITVFFVPLFPLSTKYRDTCTACGRVIEISRQQAEQAERAGQGGWADGTSSSPGRSLEQPAPAPTPQDRPVSEWPPQDRPA